MSIEILLWTLGCVILLFFVIGGLLWSRRKSKQEEERFRRSRLSVGRTLTRDELQYPFGQPPAPATLQTGRAFVHRIRRQPVVALPATVSADDPGLDIDLDAIVDVAEATVAGARIIGAVIVGAASSEEASEAEACRRPDDTEEGDEKPQAVVAVCATTDVVETTKSDGETAPAATSSSD